MFDGGIVTIIFAFMAIVLAFSAIKVVPQGQQWTVERFGRFTGSLRPGIAFLVPFVDRVGRRMSMMEAVMDVPRQDVITKDNAVVSVDAVVFIQVVDAARASYEVENYKLAILNLCLTNVRTVVGSMDLDEVLSQRDAINARLLTVVDAATQAWGVKVLRVEIKDLTPPADLTQSMARQMKAERERRAQILEAEGDKQAAVLRAEGAKQSAILEAEGRREAAYRDAEARERSAEAEAKATEAVSAAISKGDVNAIRYFLGLKYVEAFSQLASSNQQRTVIIPSDLGGLAGLVEGLRALNAQGEASGGGPWSPPAPAR
jgi:regulator of protease activity HflC (stomatin/prohibitin superfamily)